MGLGNSSALAWCLELWLSLFEATAQLLHTELGYDDEDYG
jgi:hypothetical protein